MELPTYANHRRYVPVSHGVLGLLLLAIFVRSLVNLYVSVVDHQGVYSASLITALTLGAFPRYSIHPDRNTVHDRFAETTVIRCRLKHAGLTFSWNSHD